MSDPATYCPRDHGCSLPGGHIGPCELTAALCFCDECEAKESARTEEMTRPDATLDQLRTLIDLASERHLHDAEQWLRERVEAAERLMLHGPGVLTTKTLSEVLGLTPEQEAERVAGLNAALSRISDMERGR